MAKNLIDIEDIPPQLANKVKQDLRFKTGNFVWRVRFNIPLDPHTVNKDTMYVTNSQNQKLRSYIRYDTKNEIIETLQRVGLNPKMKKPVSKYSLGMRQRLGIAQAIMENPDVLILDEPFNGLDKAGVAEMRQLLLSLKESGKAIMLASHNAQDIEMLCDYVHEMEDWK